MIEPESAPQQTITSSPHMDSSRSGIDVSSEVHAISGQGVICGRRRPDAERSRSPDQLDAASRLLVKAARLIGLSALLVLRNCGGEDVPGANDNASGVAACLNLAEAIRRGSARAQPPRDPRDRREESGVIGMREFLQKERHRGWIFINFDGVSADAPLRVPLEKADRLAQRRIRI